MTKQWCYAVAIKSKIIFIICIINTFEFVLSIIVTKTTESIENYTQLKEAVSS